MKKKLGFKKCTLMADNSQSIIAADSREAFAARGFSDSDIEYYINRLVGVLDDYTQHFGEGTEFEYIIFKRLGRLEIRVSIPGEKYDPFENGEDSRRRRIEKALNVNLNSQVSVINYAYFSGRNIITGSIPLDRKEKNFLKDPVVAAIVLGILTGILCLHIPKDASGFIIDELLSPVNDVVLKVLTGIMGPFIFITLVSSIIALDSINDLTDMGFKIFRRFSRVIMFFIIVSIGISLLFFGRIGGGRMDFSPSQIITMLLNTIPVNPIQPFAENNMPQIVMLAFLSGIALLLLGEKVSGLNEIIHQCNDWIMKIVSLVLKITPIVPFLSIAMAIGTGKTGDLLDGWKFIIAVYIIFTVCIVVKAVKTSIRTKTSIPELYRTIKPAIRTGLFTAQTNTALNDMYEISDKMKIKREFSSFWVPMCSAMLCLKTTVNVIAACIMMTQVVDTPVSITFLFILVILTFEMTIASPGTVSSWVIAFEALSLPTSYVGLFSTYRLLYNNYSSAAVVAYFMCEELEAAHAMDAIEETETAEAAHAQ